ncbi:hypothetical protein BHE74_00028898 [Ensete ventricosum]|nr:hypothetical protein GW17_00002888 [Ensete ventricosum]RWW63906.1 hypothetical protein BHE74_00028898 [Ensete ventricosum]RZS06730.1 hypothetical protein BHM03_00037442 [Ensete ventricosum]
MFVAAFSSVVEGKNEELSTDELSGGARIHYIFQSIFVKSLEFRYLFHFDEPWCSISIINDQVPFDVLVRRQISRLLDPSLQCAKFIYDELIKVYTSLNS